MVRLLVLNWLTTSLCIGEGPQGLGFRDRPFVAALQSDRIIE